MKRTLVIGAIILIAALVVIGVLVARKWPFSEERVAESLSNDTGTRIRIGRYRETFFPHVGAVAEDVTGVRDGQSPPLLSARKITIEASWIALLTMTHRVSRLRIDGLHVYIANPLASAESGAGKKSTTTISELMADGAVLEISRKQPGAPNLVFQFRQLLLHNVGRGQAIPFHTVFQNPEPPGVVAASGSFGPWQVDETPVSGSFELTHAGLSHYHGIAGTLAAKGKFKGKLAQIDVTGAANVPDFEVTSSGHRVGVQADFQALVDGRHGDVTLQSLHSRFLHTNADWHGVIAGTQGKTAALDFTAGGRVEDMLRLVSKADPPGFAGAITCQAHVVLPPDKEPFLRKLRLSGSFNIGGGEFTKTSTQSSVDRLSERAHGGDNDDAVNVSSKVAGHVEARNGIARLTDLSFEVPGARAQLEGTFDLLTHRVDLHGKLATQASLSQDAGGLKKWLLLPLDPFFKKKHAGAVIPIQITGIYPHASVRASLTGKR